MNCRRNFTTKQQRLQLRHTEASIEDSGWGLLYPQHILKSHICYLLGCRTSTLASRKYVNEIVKKT
jgi:hypothetical protein